MLAANLNPNETFLAKYEEDNTTNTCALYFFSVYYITYNINVIK